MKIKKYYGKSNKDPWYLQKQVKWYKKLLVWFINPKLTCVICNNDVMRLLNETNKCMGVKKDNVYCGTCYDFT